jgi:hypothetical protein
MKIIQNELNKMFGLVTGHSIFAIIIISVFYIIFALIFSLWPFSVASGVINKVTSPNAIIQNYEYFYSMNAEIDATKRKAVIAKGTEEEKGIKMVLESMIAEYNAKSRMITRNMWKAQDLPYQIESDQ